MSLTILTIITITTSPWFILITFEKIIPAKFYLPEISELLRNFFSYLSFDFLFFSGDPIVENSIPEIGVFHLLELPFFLLGFYLLCSNFKKYWWIIGFLIETTIFASFFKPPPNIFSAIPLFLITSFIITMGFKKCFDDYFKKISLVKLLLGFLFLLFIFYNSFFFWHQYKIHYSKRLEKIKAEKL